MGDSDAGTARKKRRYRTRKIVPRTPDAIDPGDHRKYDGSQGIGGKIDGRGDRTQSATEGSEAAALAAAAVRDESGDAARTAETETTQANQENILGVEEQPKRAYRSKYRQRLAEQEAAVTAKTILDILNGTASALVAPEAEMNTEERALIEPPLSRVVARISPDIADRIQIFSDPIMCLVGFSLWAYRIQQMVQNKPSETNAIPAAELLTPTPPVQPAPETLHDRDNGHNTEFPPATPPENLRGMVDEIE